MSSSLLLQQCPACLVRLTWIVFVMGGRWHTVGAFMGYCLQDLFEIAPQHSCVVAVKLFSIRLVSVHVVHPYSSMDTTAAWMKLLFILSVRFDFHMTVSLIDSCPLPLLARVSMSTSVNETLLLYVDELVYKFQRATA